jgi:hypothetical protein
VIYDPIVGWNGTLNYLESGTGYMIKSSKSKLRIQVIWQKLVNLTGKTKTA